MSSLRKILLAEQQELRVVLAHLRAISFDTVRAIVEWRVRAKYVNAYASEPMKAACHVLSAEGFPLDHRFH